MVTRVPLVHGEGIQKNCGGMRSKKTENVTVYATENKKCVVDLYDVYMDKRKHVKIWLSMRLQSVYSTNHSKWYGNGTLKMLLE